MQIDDAGLSFRQDKLVLAWTKVLLVVLSLSFSEQRTTSVYCTTSTILRGAIQLSLLDEVDDYRIKCDDTG